ncbi:MAG: hypothetical protein U0L92_07480 [Clostridia bacterium]|nr:hypothetical protein [Clostridia bacterium]
MNTKVKTKDLVISALLIAIGILIPMIFTGLPFRIVVGPYSATLMAHVPVIIAMFISPWTAVFTAIGTTIGFFFTAPLIVAVRAASHVAFAILGAALIKKGMRALPLCILTGILHAVLEGIVVMIFYVGGFSTPNAGYTISLLVLITIVGTFIHHCVDFVISYAVGKGLARAKMLPALPRIW